MSREKDDDDDTDSKEAGLATVGNNPNLELDAGAVEGRVREKWWQLWVPRSLPPPAPLSLDDAPITPIVTASLFSKLTYSWITPMMMLGASRTLQASDLWKVDETMEAGILSEKLDAAWARRVKEADEWNMKLERGEVGPSVLRCCVFVWHSRGSPRRYRKIKSQWMEVGGRKRASLAWSLNDVFWRIFWIGGIFKVWGDTSQLMGPLLVKAIINFAKDRANARDDGTPPPSIGRGIGMAIGLLLIVVSSSLTQHQFFWRSMTTGVLARAALINSLYKRGVVLTGKSRAKFTNSTLVSFISSDVSRIDVASQWFHASWTAPIQITVCLIILLVELGPSALAGFLIFIVLAPIQQKVMAQRLRIRTESVKFTDERSHVLLEVLSSMRIVKYFCYEVPFLKRIFDIRKNELQGIRTMHHAQSAITAFAYSTPVLAATLAFVTYTSTTPGFDVAVIFSSFSLFQLLRQPMMFLPRSLSNTADARNALTRLSEFFHADLMSDDPFTIDPDQKLALDVDNVTFEWDVDTSAATLKDSDRETEQVEDRRSLDERSISSAHAPFRLKDVSMKVPRGQLVAVVGRVGSGKSSLLQGLIGEMRMTSGKFTFGGKVAYCAQSAWIQNASLRENVLFGQSYNDKKYWAVMEKACLIPDLVLLPDGDLTEIGEKGINLSGGQKQRINIARALYYEADVILFDDPLSAVDAHVGKSLFHHAIAPLAASGKTVILVTHAQHFLSHCDYIFVLSNGEIAEQGTYKELISNDGEFARLDREFGGHTEESSASTSVVRIGANTIEEVKLKSDKRMGAGTGKLEGRLIRKENRTTGSVDKRVYLGYFKAGRGWFMGPFLIICLLLMQASQISNSYTLVWWQANTFNRSFSFYQILYACLGISQAIFTFLVGAVMDIISVNVSSNLHHNSIRNIFYATMSFFDTTPTGRIMGVFGKDVDSMDNQLPTSMRLFVLTLSSVLGAVVIISVIEHYFLIIAFAMIFGYNYFASFYRRSAREMKRLDSMLRSMLYAHFSESLTGLPTIRSYGEINRFIKDNRFFIDLEDRALLLTVTNQRWLAVRVDALGAVMVFCIAIMAVVGVSGINAAQVGLVLTYMNSLTQMCGMVTRQSAEVENYMNSVERVVDYSDGKHIEQEAPHDIPDSKPPPDWPTQGSVQFKDVSLSYRPGLPNVLHGISIDVKGGEKIGIVGRTGAGKSSLVMSLLRIVEFSGSVTIDGIDISKIGLNDLRKSISIIPQDPTLFSGTVRTALDPFSIYDDARLWDALRRSYLVNSETTPRSSIDLEKSRHFTVKSRITLDTVIETDGANLSVGERSLLSLARALVKDSKVVILDEATASVDLETDRKIQETIQTQFDDRTLLCIAHRLRTIISYDRILVLDAGMVSEFDTPLSLYNRDNGIFRGLCDRSNISRADILAR